MRAQPRRQPCDPGGPATGIARARQSPLARRRFPADASHLPEGEARRRCCIKLWKSEKLVAGHVQEPHGPSALVGREGQQGGRRFPSDKRRPCYSSSGGFVTNENKSRGLDVKDLERMRRSARAHEPCALQQAFGLRREESIKFQPRYADRGERIFAQGLVDQRRPARSVVPITTPEQRAMLDQAHQLARRRFAHTASQDLQFSSAIPTTGSARRRGLSRMHGLRHRYAQSRYEVLTGCKAPAAGAGYGHHLRNVCSTPLLAKSSARNWVMGVRRSLAVYLESSKTAKHVDYPPDLLDELATHLRASR